MRWMFNNVMNYSSQVGMQLAISCQSSLQLGVSGSEPLGDQATMSAN